MSDRQTADRKASVRGQSESGGRRRQWRRHRRVGVECICLRTSANGPSADDTPSPTPQATDRQAGWADVRLAASVSLRPPLSPSRHCCGSPSIRPPIVPSFPLLSRSPFVLLPEWRLDNDAGGADESFFFVSLRPVETLSVFLFLATRSCAASSSIRNVQRLIDRLMAAARWLAHDDWKAQR